MIYVSILLSTLLACSDKSTNETGGSTNVLNITNVRVSSVNCDMEEIPEDVLTVTVEAGIVQMVHENYEESSCLSFGVDGVLDAMNLNVDYSKSGEECDCIDIYRLEYDIEDLDSGTYTLNAPGGVSASIVVE